MTNSLQRHARRLCFPKQKSRFFPPSSFLLERTTITTVSVFPPYSSGGKIAFIGKKKQRTRNHEARNTQSSAKLICPELLRRKPSPHHQQIPAPAHYSGSRQRGSRGDPVAVLRSEGVQGRDGTAPGAEGGFQDAGRAGHRGAPMKASAGQCQGCHCRTGWTPGWVAGSWGWLASRGSPAAQAAEPDGLSVQPGEVATCVRAGSGAGLHLHSSDSRCVLHSLHAPS